MKRHTIPQNELGSYRTARQAWGEYTDNPAQGDIPYSDRHTHKSYVKREFVRLLDDGMLPPKQRRGPDLRGIFSKSARIKILQAYRNSIRVRAS